MMQRFLARALSLLGLFFAPALALAVASDALEAPSSAASDRRNVSFSRDVIPALTKAGCNSGACHGSFQGRGGLRLSLLGFDPAQDHEALTKVSRGRRINTAAPGQSLLLRKALGQIPHGGGRRMAENSAAAEILRRWLAAGAPPAETGELAGLTIVVEPTNVVLSANGPSQPVQLQVTARFGDGSLRDVTPWALYDVRESLIAEVSRTGQIAAQTAGRTAVTVRYLGQVATVSVSVPYAAGVAFDFPAVNFIDELAVAQWRKMGAVPAPLAGDETFLRRVYLDLIGTLPTAEEVRAFVADPAANKRSLVIDSLLARPEYVDYWTLKWGDLLRVHRRYLGDKGLVSFQQWLKQAVRENKPIDKLARELLTAQGNLFTNGPVAYFFIDEKVEDLAETTAQVFLGVRMQCTRCHHHPNEVWSQEDYYGLAAMFSRLETKDSGQAGARFGGPKSIRAIPQPNPQRKPAIAALPRVFGAPLPSEGPGAADPRVFLADWMTQPDNAFFAKNFVNRYWAALVGRGLVEPVDDLRATNPASLPELFNALAHDFVAQGFDAKHLLKTICNSRLYQLDAELHPERDQNGQLFTHRVPRRLSAEVLLDAINQVAGSTETFAGQPPGTRAIALPDPTIASHFLTTFGRPLRNSPCDCARGASPDLSQALHLVNSPQLHAKLTSETGRLATLLKSDKGTDAIADELYLHALGRRPTIVERGVIDAALREGSNREEVWQDVLWALFNCSEFVFNH